MDKEYHSFPTFLLPTHSMWLLVIICLSFVVSSSSSSSFGEGVVHGECSFTRYPKKCMETVMESQGLGFDDELHKHSNMVYSLVLKTREETMLSTDKLSTLDDHPLGELMKSKSLKANSSIGGYCDEMMKMSLKRLDQTMKALKASPREKKEDIQTWLSAVITFQEACKDSIKDDLIGVSTMTTSTMASQITGRMNHLSVLASNALAMANRIPETTQLPERRLTSTSSSSSNFPDWVSVEDRNLLESTDFKPHAVVAQDGSGDFMTISEAIDAVGSSLQGGGKKVIFIKAGVYKQKLSVKEDNVMLVGAGKGATLITNDDSVGGGTSMPNTATVVVTGDGFFAKDIGFENSAGADNHQALALRISSDHAVLYHCTIRGHQDTLYAVALRQFYTGCDIYGSIDYIFGNAAAVFQGCNLLFQKPHHKGINTVMANGRSDPGQNTGFSVQGCVIGAGPELAPVKDTVKSFLGRPWKEYSRAVVMQSNIDDSIQPSGWSVWSGSFALNTLYFAEYSNGGPGASTSGRVNWKGFHVLGTAEASKFTVANFISGSSWIPAGVPYKAGL